MVVLYKCVVWLVSKVDSSYPCSYCTLYTTIGNEVGSYHKDVKKRSSVSLELPNNREVIARHGTVREFVSEREDWSSYIEQLENHFAANDVVTAEKKCVILLSVRGVVHIN